MNERMRRWRSLLLSTALLTAALAQARVLQDLAESAPKSMKWKLRANVGDRVRWYELPEDVRH